jgi:tetratricopeptide (TPR) repeat protein
MAAPAFAGQHGHGASPGRLGTVHFATSCAPAVQPTFDRGIALLHSFWFSAAVESFTAVLKDDPRCVMAHWGIAMSWWGNPFGGFRAPQALAAGLAASDAARANGAGSDRERAYLAAVDTLFRDAATRDQRTRTLAYEKAMEALAARYPDDAEARILYALALGQTALPTDKTYANQLRAAGLLELEFKTQPEHPGLAHYIIHSFDVPPLAPRALDAARRYAAIAPDAPHALHMPSHTFTRVGLWQESIETNLASAVAARKDPGAASEELHALDYQVYAYLQTAQDAAARRTLPLVEPLAARVPNAGVGNAAPPSAGYFAAAAIPARYALERAAWAEAAALVPPQTPFGWVDAVTHFARALGAARSGQVAAAREDVARLLDLRGAVERTKDAYWTEQVEIQRLGAEAWVLLTEGRPAEALTLMREAADREDATEKSVVTPGPIKPARELLGEMLLQLKRPAEALAAFEATLTKEPNRFRAVYGAAAAADAAGNKLKAAEHYASLLKTAARADQPPRRELTQAQGALR